MSRYQSDDELKKQLEDIISRYGGADIAAEKIFSLLASGNSAHAKEILEYLVVLLDDNNDD